MWSLIAGAVEEGESLVAALKREVYEETGLGAEPYALFGTFSDPSRILSYDDGNIHRVITIAYSVVVKDFNGLRVSEESEPLAFFQPYELDSLDMPATQRPIIDRFRSSSLPPFLD